MTPQELSPYLLCLVEQKIQFSLMLWGPLGIGKSSIVAYVAREHDLRLLTAVDGGVSRCSIKFENLEVVK